MQKELEFPASFCGLQEKKKKKKTQWKTWYMHPFLLLSTSLGRMTATSQRVKNSEANTWQQSFFFSFLFTEEWKSGIRQTSQNSLYFPCCLCSRCCYPLRATHDPETLCCYFQYKISIEGLLDVLQCLFSTPAYMLFTKCKTNWTFELAATSERALVNTTLHVIVFKS